MKQNIRADQSLKKITLNDRQICDVDLLLGGGFAPLTGFLDQKNYDHVLDTMCLCDGSLWPIPIYLDVAKDFAKSLKTNDTIELRDKEGILIAYLTVSSIWKADKQKEALAIYGTEDQEHPGVAYLMNECGDYYLGGELTLSQLPVHYDFKAYRFTADELKNRFKKLGWTKILAFQTRNPMHKAHFEISKRASAQTRANLLIHPVVGPTKQNDIDYFTRVRCYEKILDKYPENTCELALLNLAMRMAGPREAVWHALIRKNYGCTHFVIGRDHAGVKKQDGTPFYDPCEARRLAKSLEDEIGLEIIGFEELLYVKDLEEYKSQKDIPEGMKGLKVSGSELRKRLLNDQTIPEWFSFPEILDELKKTYPPKKQRGFTIFFTGLSGSGKSTIANALRVKLLELGNRNVTLLDGDIVRTHLSSELTFSKEHRDLNIERIGFVASLISQNNAIAICAPIAPYAKTRAKVRTLIEEKKGAFFEIHVATPLEVCEARDRKGLYKLARAGKIKNFTGIDDPYEAPKNPDMRLDTTEISPDQAAHSIILMLKSEGYL